MVFLEDIPLLDAFIPVGENKNQYEHLEAERQGILDVLNRYNETIISVIEHKTTFTIKNNIARLNLRGNGRVFKNFEISELEEIIKMIDNKSLSRMKDKNASASKFLYYLKVWKETEANAVRVKNIELRGKDYHLDHIIPITYCFYNNICHTKAGGLLNLQIISHIDNMSKNVKVNLSELYRVH